MMMMIIAGHDTNEMVRWVRVKKGGSGQEVKAEVRKWSV